MFKINFRILLNFKLFIHNLTKKISIKILSSIKNRKAQNIKFESKTLNKENVTDESEHFTSVVTTSEHLKIDNQEDKKDNITEDSAHTAFSAGTSYCKSKDELCTLHGVEKQYIEDANSSVEQESDADESFNFEIVENAERGMHC